MGDAVNAVDARRDGVVAPNAAGTLGALLWSDLASEDDQITIKHTKNSRRLFPFYVIAASQLTRNVNDQF